MPHAHVDQAWIHKLVGTDVYRRMTIRNVNTVRKLRELMEAMG